MKKFRVNLIVERAKFKEYKFEIEAEDRNKAIGMVWQGWERMIENKVPDNKWKAQSQMCVETEIEEV